MLLFAFVISQLKTLKHNLISSNYHRKSPSTTKACFNGCDLRDSKEEKKGIKMCYFILKVCNFWVEI
jgi:hypothetical protein